MLQGMGAIFFDSSNEQIFEAIGGIDLPRIKRCDMEIPLRLLNGRELIICSDVQNPLCGPDGAAYVFAPQKGATPEQLIELDRNLEYFFNLLKEQCFCQTCSNPGDGAAGGTGFALQEILHGKICSGGEYLLKLADFPRYAAQADILITGEGRSDMQTLQGKLPLIVARHARNAGVPAILVSGSVALDSFDALSEEFAAVISLCHEPEELSAALTSAPENLRRIGRNILQFWRAAQR